jgi:glycosyltransferase involved in cell wall biosynthesis
MTPTISVIMPVYNAERFVAETTDTVLNQTFGDFEFVIIDDGSKDRSREILEGYAKRDPRVRVVSRPNTGYVRALNEALDLSRGEFVARIDADDLCRPERFEKQLAAFRADSSLVCVGSCAEAIDEDGHKLGHYDTPLTHEAIEASHLVGDSAIHHPSAMFRREVVRQLGNYRLLDPCEDYDLWLRLGEVGRLANLAERLVAKRLFAGSVVATTSASGSTCSGRSWATPGAAAACRASPRPRSSR